MRRLDNAALGAEIAPWIEQYSRGIDALIVAVDSLDASGSGGPPEVIGAERDAVFARLQGLRSTGLRAFGDRVDMFLSDIVGEFSSR
nr:hypothetical protein GCM10025699_13590 [Microbacterium flavescens]